MGPLPLARRRHWAFDPIVNSRDINRISTWRNHTTAVAGLCRMAGLLPSYCSRYHFSPAPGPSNLRVMPIEGLKIGLFSLPLRCAHGGDLKFSLVHALLG